MHLGKSVLSRGNSQYDGSTAGLVYLASVDGAKC